MIRIVFSFARGVELQYLSHLDLMRLLQRALRRARLPVAYSQGFNPHPRLSLAAPLPVGVTASREYGELFLKEPVAAEALRRSLNEQLPAGLELTGARVAELQEPSLAAEISAARYRAVWSGDGSTAPGADVLKEALDRLLSRPAITVARRGKDGRPAETDIRPYILDAVLPPENKGLPELELLLQVGSRGGVSPFLVLNLLELGGSDAGEYLWRVHRYGLYIYRDRLEDPFPV